MAVGQEALDGVECGGFDEVDHDRRGKHRYEAAAHFGGGMLDADQQLRRSLHPRLQARQMKHPCTSREPRRGRIRQCITVPPSTAMVCPVTKRLASDTSQ